MMFSDHFLRIRECWPIAWLSGDERQLASDLSASVDHLRLEGRSCDRLPESSFPTTPRGRAGLTIPLKLGPDQ
jgi:hypothetical protein